MRFRYLLIAATMLCLVCGTVSAAWNPATGLILQGDVVTMTAEDAVIPGGRIFIKDEKIVAIVADGEAWPEGVDPGNAPLVDTQGWIFPGMLNLHNHTAYNVLPLWEAPKLYTNRYQWTTPKTYSTYVNYPKKLLTDSNYFNLTIEVCKYAEVKAISGGETAIQGTPGNKGIIDMLIRNVEAKNFGQDKVYQRGLSIEDPRWQKTLPKFLAKADEGAVDAWIVHLAEGVDEDPSHQEFQILKNIDMLHSWTVAIHATALQALDFAEMADANAKIVWSPTSNMLLYGMTTRIDHAIAAGMLVSLATDWSPSGPKNLLDELKIAWELNNHMANTIKDYLPFNEWALAQMVTSNAADILNWGGLVGRLKPGLYADIMVIKKPVIVAEPEQSPGGGTDGNDGAQGTDGVEGADGADGADAVDDADGTDSGDGTDGAQGADAGGGTSGQDPEGDDAGGDGDPAPDPDPVAEKTPYQALIEATVKDIELVLVSGEPLYGALTHMQALKPADFEVLCSTAGFVKAVDVTRDGIKKGEQTYEMLVDTLQTAMQFGHEHMRQSFKQSVAEGWTIEQFDEWFAAKFKNGVESMTLDPLYVTDDPVFFQRLQGSTNANFPFDLQALYYPYLGDGPTKKVDSNLVEETELLDFINNTPETELSGDAGLSEAVVAAIVNGRPFADKESLQVVLDVCTVVMIESHVAKLKDPPEPPDPPDPSDPPDPPEGELGKLLSMLNHITCTLEYLDDDVGLNKKAAQALVTHRNGPDGLHGSADDNYFDTEAEVDGVAYVGPSALQKLKTHADTWVPVDPGGPKPEQKALDFLNHPSTTFVLLDDTVGLNKNAALALIAHRNGPDAVFGTLDDNLYDDLDEIDAVPYMGPSALSVLQAYVDAWNKPDKDTEILDFVNDPLATFEIFDEKVGLTSLATKKLVSHRNGADGEYGTEDDNPFDTLEELDSVPYIGPSALEKLTTFAPFWASLPKGPPKVALFLNHETVNFSVLKDSVGVSSKAASNLIAHRNGADLELGTADDDPFDSITEIDDVKYVGQKTLSILLDYAETWVAP